MSHTQLYLEPVRTSLEIGSLLVAGMAQTGVHIAFDNVDYGSLPSTVAFCDIEITARPCRL